MIIKNKKGFTLLEILLYIAILSTIILLISTFLTTMVSARIKMETVSEVNFQGFQIIKVISQKVKNTEEVLSPEKGMSSTSLILNDGIKNTSIAIADDVIYIQEEGGIAINLTSNNVLASNLSFQNLGGEFSPDSVRMSFKLERINNTGRSEYYFQRDFQSTVSLSNLNH